MCEDKCSRTYQGFSWGLLQAVNMKYQLGMGLRLHKVKSEDVMVDLPSNSENCIALCHTY